MVGLVAASPQKTAFNKSFAETLQMNFCSRYANFMVSASSTCTIFPAKTNTPWFFPRSKKSEETEGKRHQVGHPSMQHQWVGPSGCIASKWREAPIMIGPRTAGGKPSNPCVMSVMFLVHMQIGYIYFVMCDLRNLQITNCLLSNFFYRTLSVDFSEEQKTTSPANQHKTYTSAPAVLVGCMFRSCAASQLFPPKSGILDGVKTRPRKIYGWNLRIFHL